MDSEAPKPHPDEELADVFDTQQESEALVVKGLLESAGIESILTGLDASQDVLPGVGGVLVRVAQEDAAEALRLIEDYRSNQGNFDSDVPDDAGPSDESAA